MDFERERKAIKNKFCSIVNKLIIDPQFRYQVTGVEVIDRLSMTGGEQEKVFIINVKTNNRSQLLGQIYPFKPGGYSGYFNNFFAGRIIEMMEREFNPSYRFFITINAEPFQEEDTIRKVDKHISLQEAINQGILKENSPLAKKMKEYNLNSLIIAGGTVITGPLYDSIKTMEKVCEKYKINTVLDMFCGSGSLSKVALTKGADFAECVDIDLTSAKKNLEDFKDKVKFHEMDAFDFKLNRKYDLIIADPYYEMAADFIDKILPKIPRNCKYFFMTVAFIDDRYWANKVIKEISKHFEEIEKFNTGRMLQILGKFSE